MSMRQVGAWRLDRATGAGTGEFEQPRAAALMAQGGLVVAEESGCSSCNLPGEASSIRGALSLDVPAQDFCLLGDTIVTTGSRRSGPVLHLRGSTAAASAPLVWQCTALPNEMVNEDVAGAGRL
ncbi:MAG: hypothetical protein IPL76_03225 [Gemmatimonadetes bacterium]|nr:hypothetical protein [Gemmatimonadota bacterium]